MPLKVLFICHLECRNKDFYLKGKESSCAYAVFIFSLGQGPCWKQTWCKEVIYLGWANGGIHVAG